MNAATWRLIGFVSITAAVVACSPTDVCHDGIWLETAPADTTLAVGESFEPRVRMEQCPDPRSVEATLATDDDGVVAISDGSIRAVGVGKATVTATFQGLMASLSVEVVE